MGPGTVQGRSRAYIPGEMSRLYHALEPFVREEVKQEVDTEFRRKNPTALPRKLNWDNSKDHPLAREWLRIRDRVLKEWRKGCFLSTPQAVSQKQQPLCWAAVMESWLAVALKIKMPVKDLVKRFAADKTTGALTIRQDPILTSMGAPRQKNELKELFGSYAMAWQLKRSHRLTYKYLWEKLREKGHLVVFYGSGSLHMAHTVLVFSIFIGANGRSMIYIMDPMKGVLDVPLATLKAYNVVVAWKAYKQKLFK